MRYTPSFDHELRRRNPPIFSLTSLVSAGGLDTPSRFSSSVARAAKPACRLPDGRKGRQGRQGSQGSQAISTNRGITFSIPILTISLALA